VAGAGLPKPILKSPLTFSLSLSKIPFLTSRRPVGLGLCLCGRSVKMEKVFGAGVTVDATVKTSSLHVS